MRFRESPRRLLFLLKVLPTMGLWLLVWRNRYLEIKGDHLLYHAGTFSKHERTITLDRILDVSVKQGMLGRTLGYGYIEIETAAGPATEFSFRNLSRPIKLREIILQGL